MRRRAMHLYRFPASQSLRLSIRDSRIISGIFSMFVFGARVYEDGT